jgi:catechol 2,3-dioxygenase-like lactoylglutathione lyase family enzyme
MGIPVSGVSELVLEVVDLEASEHFYADVLGLPVVDRWPGRGAIWVMAGERTRIGLWLPQVGLYGSRGGVHVHFALHIEEADYDAAVARLRTAGAEVIEHEFPTRPHSRSAYVNDPDGHLVEFWTWDVAGHLTQSKRSRS